jgi:hypothetical protein
LGVAARLTPLAAGVAVLDFVAAIAALLGRGPRGQDPLALAAWLTALPLASVFLLVAYFIYRKSRLLAILLFAVHASNLIAIPSFVSLTVRAIPMVLTAVCFVGMVGAFAHHALEARGLEG